MQILIITLLGKLATEPSIDSGIVVEELISYLIHSTQQQQLIPSKSLIHQLFQSLKHIGEVCNLQWTLLE